MLKPKVSIITVVYNAKEELQKTIESISSIKYANIEYIIVDGGSNDGTKQVIEQNSLKITKWVSEPDNGIYDAMNKGLSMAEGDYVWFINAGDMAFSSEVLNNIFSGQEVYADIYYGDTVILDKNGNALGLRKKKLPKKLSLRSFRKGMVVCHQSIIVRRKMAPKYNLKWKYASDIEWVMESTKRAKHIVNTKFILSKFTEGGVSAINRKESLKERCKIMRCYYGAYKTFIYHIAILSDVFKPKYRKIKKPY